MIQKSFFRVLTSSVFCLCFTTLSFAAVDLVVNHSDSPDPVPAGGNVTYSIKVSNNGADNSATTTLTVTIPASATYISDSSSDGVSCSGPVNNILTCNFDSLAGDPVNEEKEVAIVLKTHNQGIITVGAVATTDGSEGTPANNTDDEVTTVNQGANLQLTKTASRASAPSGSPLEYNLAILNNGPDTASLLRIEDPIPSGFQLTSLPSGCTNSAGTIVCDINSSLANGASLDIGPIQGIITSAGSSTLTNAASVGLQPSAPSGTPKDPETSDNTSTVNTTVTAGSDVTLNKSRSTGGSLLVGTDFNFVISPGYSGDVPTGLTVTDTVPTNYTIRSGDFQTTQNGWSCSLSDQDVSCTRANGGASAGYNQAIDDIVIPVTVNSSGNNVTNNASISTTSIDPNPANNTANDGGVNLVDPTVDLGIDKAGPSPALVVTGIPFNFDVHVNNTGTTGFYGIARIIDTIPNNMTINSYSLNGWSCSPATPVVGPATITCERTYTSDSQLGAGVTSPSVIMTAVTATDGHFTNNATISTPDCNLSECNDGDLDSYSVISSIGPDSADISLLKRVIGPDPVLAGESLTYELEIVNTGPTTSTNVRLTDTFSQLINNSVGAAGAGFIDVVNASGTATFTNCTDSASGSYSRSLSCTYASIPICTAGTDCPVVTVRVRPGGDGGARTNTANVISNDTADPDHSNESASATSAVTPRADIAVAKNVTPANIAAGQNLTYVVTVSNNGPSRATDVVMTDTLPHDVTFVSATPSSGSCATKPATGSTTAGGNDSVSCNLGTINNGSQQTVTLVVRPNTATRSTTLVNTATAVTSTLETDGPANTVNPNNSASVNADVLVPSLDLVLNKDDSIDPVAVGDQTVYTITVTNSGPSAAENVMVTDTLPATGLSFVSASSSSGSCPTQPAIGDDSGANVVCNLGYLASAAQETITVTMRAEVKGIYTNTAVVSSTETGLGFESAANNNVPETTTVRTKADMDVESKIATPATVNLRDNFIFTVKIRNNGGDGLAEADDVNLSDTLPSGMELTGTPTVGAPSSGSITLSICSGNAGETSFSCSLGTVATDTEVDISVPVQLVNVSSMPQTFTNTATVTTSSLDVEGSNNSNSGDVTTNSSSLAGRVYRDFNNNGSVDAGDTGISGVPITLSGTSFDGAAVSRTVNSDNNGNFIFSGLPQSDGSGYTIVEGVISEGYLNDGIDTVGTAGGDAAAVNDQVSDIVLAANTTTSGYLFAEVPVARIGIAKRVQTGPTVQADGTFITSFRLLVENFSLEQLNNISISDNLTAGAAPFGALNTSPLANGQYLIETTPSGSCGGANASYNGSTNTSIASGFNLAAGTTCTVDFSVRLRPSSPLPAAQPSGGRYENQASVTATGALSGQAPADDSVNGSNPDPNHNDQAEESGPTPVSPSYGASIGVAKELTGLNILADGKIKATFELTIANTGNEPLSNVVLNDPLAGAAPAFGSSSNPPTVPGQFQWAGNTFPDCPGSTPNFGYDGDSDPVVATISSLPIGQSCSYLTIIEFIPLTATTYSNQANATADADYTGISVSDLSDDGSDPDSNNNGISNEAGENDPTPVPYPRIGLAKRVVGSTTTDSDGTVNVPFSFVVKNLGGETLTSITLSDDLSGASPQFGSHVASGPIAANEYTIETAPAFSGACSGTANAAFNGNDTPTVATISSLASGATCIVTTTVKFRPGAPLPPGGNYTNQATVTATGAASSQAVSDSSDDGTNPDADNDGLSDEAGENDPTPANVSFTPQIALNKHLTASETVNADGTVTVPFRVKVINSGTEPLLNLAIDDHLAGVAPRFGTFVAGGASATITNSQYTVQTAPTFNGSCTTGTLTAAYDGDSQDQLAALTRLEVLDSCEIDFALRFRPTSPLPGGGYNNQATAAGTGEFSGGAPVTDQSHNGLDPDPDGNDDPTDNSNPTPVPLNYTPAIGLAKELSLGTIVDSSGSYRGTFRISVKNLGNEDLTGVTITDAMNSAPSNLGTFVAGGSSVTLNAGQYTIESAPAFVGSCLNGSVNSGFNGASTAQLATIGELETGASCTLDYGFRFVPSPGINYVNQASTNGSGAFSTIAVNDLSDNGSSVDGNGNNDATEAGENDPTPIAYPRVGLAKQVIDSAITHDNGTISVSFSFVAANLGAESLNAVTISDDLSGASPQFGTYIGGGAAANLTANQYTIEVAPVLNSCSGGVLSPGFNGDSNQTLATIANFASGATCSLTTTIRFRPGLPFPVGGNYTNQASILARGGVSGIDIDDLSDNGIQPDSDGDSVGNEPVDNDPTPVPVSTIPLIAVNKHLTSAEIINTDGTVTVPFRVKFSNSGTEPLLNLEVNDRLSGLPPRFGTFVAGGASATLNNGQYTVQAPPAFNGSCATGTLTAAYNGDSQDQLVALSRLEVLDFCEIDFTLRFRPISPLPISGYSNQATAQGTGEFSGGAPVSDQSHNGLDPDPDDNDDPTDNNDPTPVNPTHTAGIGIAKSLHSGLSVNTNSSYSGTIRLVVENLGNEDLLNVNISDAMNSAPSNLGTYVSGGSSATLSAGQYSIDSAPAVIGTCSNATVNTGYDGQTTSTLATISELATSTRCTFEYGFRFVPTPGTSYLNQATTTATGSFSDDLVGDLSDNGSDPDPNGNMDTGEADENDPTPIPLPRIGLAKAAGSVTNNGDGTYTVPFVLTVTNAGETSLSGIQISDDLSAFGSFTSAAVPSAGEYAISASPTVANPTNGATLTTVAADDFTGTTSGTDLLIPASSSLPNYGSGSASTAEIHFSLRFFPTTEGPFNNSATATGSSPEGGNVSDESVSGNTPDADADGDPGNDSSPTVVNLAAQVIAAAKELGSVIQLTTHSYDIPYRLIIENLSAAVTATNVQLSDNLNSTFPTAETINISSAATISGCSGTVLMPPATVYNGTTQTNLLAGNQNLQPGEQCTIDFTARIDFGVNPLPSVVQNNSARATTAETPGGVEIVQDLSDNGTDPDPDGNGNPTDAGENDPTPVDFSSSNLSTVSGQIWLDSNHDRSNNDSPASIPIFTVEVLNSAGDLVGSATSDENGNYQVVNLFPSTAADPSTYYSVRFRENVSGALYGNPLSHDPGNPNGTIVAGQIADLQLMAGTNTINQDLPLDPSGIVYDSITRTAVSGASVTLTAPIGFDPDLHLVGGAANLTQETGSTGFYQYILLATAPAGIYGLEVTPPAGYLPSASNMIPVCNNTPVIGAFPDPALVQSSSAPPTLAAPLHDPDSCPALSSSFTASVSSTQYYSSFDLDPTVSGDLINNHFPVDPILGGAIALTKTTPLVNVSIGQLVPYKITATNTLAANLSNIDLRDTLPPGFKYKNSSATLDGIRTAPTINGRVLSWTDLDIPANGSLTLSMILVVGSGVQPGEYINNVQAYNNLVPAPDNSVSNRASATVRVIPDPEFSCSDVIGKVFDDQNADGYQDQGEPPLANVRLATVRGLLVTTDAEGRFHITCAMVPNAFRGSQFIMKLDQRTLPSGYRMTTENPRTIHLTQGKMGKINFGAAIHRIIRLEMNAEAFIPDKDVIHSDLAQNLEQFPEHLRTAPSIVRLAYNKTNESDMLIRDRLKNVRQRLEQLWSDQGSCYDLLFEEEIFQRSINMSGGDK